MKKILSMVLVLVLALSCLAVASVSAADDFVPSEEPIIYFEVPEIWQSDVARVFCHIWPYGGSEGGLVNWGAKKENCTKTETENLYSYDIAKAGELQADTLYCVIFCVVTSTGTELQTYNTLFDTNCFGDTLYCDDTIYENPEDSSKVCQAAFWKNQDPTVYGPELRITSIGNITGTALPAGVTTTDVMYAFINDGTLDNALTYVDTTAEAMLTNIAGQLGVSDEDLAEIIAYVSGGTSDTQVLLGDADQNEKVNVKDATAVQKHVAGMTVTVNLDASDADMNDKINVKDATAIQKAVAGMEVNTPIGELITVA